MVGFEKALGAVKVIKDQIQYRPQSLLNLKVHFMSSQKSLAYSLRIFVDNFSLLSPQQRVLAAWLKIFN